MEGAGWGVWTLWSACDGACGLMSSFGCGKRHGQPDAICWGLRQASGRLEGAVRRARVHICRCVYMYMEIEQGVASQTDGEKKTCRHADGQSCGQTGGRTGRAGRHGRQADRVQPEQRAMQQQQQQAWALGPWRLLQVSYSRYCYLCTVECRRLRGRAERKPGGCGLVCSRQAGKKPEKAPIWVVEASQHQGTEQPMDRTAMDLVACVCLFPPSLSCTRRLQRPYSK